MKHQKLLFLLISALLIFCMSCSLHAEDVKKPETEKSLYKLKLLWSREFPEKISRIKLAPDGGRSAVYTDRHTATHIFHILYQLDNEGKELWKTDLNSLNFQFTGTRSIVSITHTGNDGKYLSYFNEEGKELWKKTVDTEPFFVGPEGKYIGYSGILNTYQQSCMDWWELRDKNFNLLWKYKPKYNIDATLLGDGKTLMVEGREIKLFGKGGQEFKKVVIPEINPHKIAYQGCVNPTDMAGPLYLKGTTDGKYAAFVYSDWNDEIKDNESIVYSVDMEKGVWWKYLTGKDSASTRNVLLSKDGKYLLLHGYYEALLFDNYTGKLLWKDSSGNGNRDIIGAAFLFINGSEYAAFNWVPGFVDEATRRKWSYFVDINTGKRLKLFDNFIFSLDFGEADSCEQAGRYILEKKGKTINKYLIMLGEEQ